MNFTKFKKNVGAAIVVVSLLAGMATAQTWSCGAESNVGGASSVQCVLDGNGRFTVSGTGAMANYNSWATPPPWYDLRNSITSLVIEEGVTTIGSHAEYNDYLKTLKFTLKTQLFLLL